MNSPLWYTVVALRGVIELVLWVMLGRMLLRMLAGASATNNSVLRLFDAFLKPPRTLVLYLLPRRSAATREGALLIILFGAWVALAFCKLWLLR